MRHVVRCSKIIAKATCIFNGNYSWPFGGRFFVIKSEYEYLMWVFGGFLKEYMILINNCNPYIYHVSF